MAEVAESTALVVVEKPKPSLVRLVAPVEELMASRQEIRDAIPRVLKRGIDIITIPGTEKEALSKAGAENVMLMTGLKRRLEILEKEIDHDAVNEFPTKWVVAPDPGWDERERRKKAGQGRSKKINGEWVWHEKGEGMERSYGRYRIVVRCVLETADGRFAGEGLGSCSTLESKYIDRPRDCENTILKMAAKRATVDAVLSACALSDRFTQDVDEGDDDMEMLRAKLSAADATIAELQRTQTKPATRAPDEVQKPAGRRRTPLQVVADLCAAIDDAENAPALDAIEEGWRKVQAGVPDKQIVMGVNAYLGLAQAQALGIQYAPDEEEQAALRALTDLRTRQGRTSKEPSSVP